MDLREARNENFNQAEGYSLVSLIVGGPTSHLGVMRPDKTAINAVKDKSVHSRLRPVTIT